MGLFRKYIGNLFIGRLWFLLMAACVILLFAAYFIHILYQPMLAIVASIVIFTLLDYVLLFFIKGGLTAARVLPPRFSIGDENRVSLVITNSFPYRLKGQLIDELPFQFQERNFQLPVIIGYKSRETVTYNLRPLSRGEFTFGNLICFASPDSTHFQNQTSGIR